MYHMRSLDQQFLFLRQKTYHNATIRLIPALFNISSHAPKTLVEILPAPFFLPKLPQRGYAGTRTSLSYFCLYNSTTKNKQHNINDVLTFQEILKLFSRLYQVKNLIYIITYNDTRTRLIWQKISSRISNLARCLLLKASLFSPTPRPQDFCWSINNCARTDCWAEMPETRQKKLLKSKAILRKAREKKREFSFLLCRNATNERALPLFPVSI